MCRDAALLLFGLSALALPAQTTTPQPGKFAVFLSRIESATSATASVIRQEVSSVLETAGVRVTWHDGRGDIAGRLAVIRLSGSCQPLFAPLSIASSSTMPRKAEALGLTHVTDGQVLSFADIRCDQIRKYVGEAVLRYAGSVLEREEMLGRAIARVVAHELYHIILCTTKHGKHGIAGATQTPEQLIARHRNFAAEDEQAISAAFVQPPPPESGAAAGAAAAAEAIDDGRRN